MKCGTHLLPLVIDNLAAWVTFTERPWSSNITRRRYKVSDYLTSNPKGSVVSPQIKELFFLSTGQIHPLK